MSSQGLIEKFIYSCSHDLRAPVSSIQGLVRIAQYYPLHDEVNKCLDMIETCTHEMDKRIANLQEYMVNNLRPVEIEDLNPEDLIGEVRHEFKAQLDTFNIKLIADVSPAALWSTDRKGVFSILKYLVSNSIAFHDPDKMDRRIIIKLDFSSAGTKLEVSDNGNGISQDQQDRIFDVFYRGTENSIGLGMGLFLAKSMVEKMGGVITCKSGLKEGTTITILFPASETALQ